MKKLCLAMLICGTAATADDTSMYANIDAFLADLNRFSIRCGEMQAGQIDQEIFGIQLIKEESGRCVLGPGEVDSMVTRYFDENHLSWAGILNGDSIWLTTQ